MCGLTYCVVSEELQVEQGKAEQHIFNLKTLLKHFLTPKASEAQITTEEQGKAKPCTAVDITLHTLI